MIDTAIGLETGTDRKLGHARLQEHFARVGLQPYLPQLGATRLKKIGQTSVEVFALSSYNLATQYNPETEELDWPQEAIEACRLFPHPMIGYYGKYHYAQQPNAFAWGGVRQDNISFSEMGMYMKKALSWLHGKGIVNPWFLLDEPPHATGERFTEDIGNRVYKVAVSAALAGWKVGICCPSPFHLRYWAERIQVPIRWILNAKHAPDAWEKGIREAERNRRAPELWIYNQKNGFAGLAAQLLTMGGTGYLHWKAEDDENPLAIIGEEDFTPLPGLATLLAELAGPATVNLETLDARLKAVERRVFG